MRYTSEPLDDRHVVAGFDCGEPSLDQWLRQCARNAEAKRVSRTFVWGDRDAVVAYYTISAHILVRDTLSRPVGRGNPDQIPAVLLGRLALDQRLQGQGLGGPLLADALARIVAAPRTVAARFVVVDAISEDAARFYEHYGFQRIQADSMRLIQRVSAIASTFK